MNTPTPRQGNFIVVRQASFGMVNSFRGGITAGFLLAALTERRLIFDWPDVVRNFAGGRLYPARKPKPNEWWLASGAVWSETGMERRDAKGAAIEEVKIDQVRVGPRFFQVQSGATSLPSSDPSIACATRLLGSRRCATNVRCIQGAAYRVLLGEPAARLAANLPAPAQSTVLGMHLRSWPVAMEGEDNPPRKVPIDDWAHMFFSCAEQALAELQTPALVYFATDEPSFRANATQRLERHDVSVVFGGDEVTHTRPSNKRGARTRSDRGSDNAVADWYALADMSHVFVGTRASTFSDAVIDRGCLGKLTHFWQLGSHGDCGRSTCASALNNFRLADDVL